MIDTNTYPTSILPASISADTFLENGGYCLYIRQPSEERFAPYVEQITTEKLFNTDNSIIRNYTSILNGLAFSIDNSTYTNPQLFLTFNSNSKLTGLLFFYEVADAEGTFFWIECWGSLIQGGGDLAMYFLGNYASERNYDIYGNLIYNDVRAEIISRPYISKDSATKWFFIKAETTIGLAQSQQEYVKSLNNFSKFYAVAPHVENPIRYDFNNKIWIDTLLNPQEDYGTPPVMTPDTFYKFDLTTRTWVPNA